MEEDSIEIIIEDSVKCESCLKKDVCVVLRSIAQKYIEFQHGLESVTTEFEIKANHEFNLSIIDCEHHVDETLLLVRN